MPPSPRPHQPGQPPVRDPVVEAAQGRAVQARLGSLHPAQLEAIRTGRGREFQRLELIGDSLLELVLHAHSVIVGPDCPHCAGRADRYTTDAHLAELARAVDLGEWLDFAPSNHRLADLVEACAGATWVSGRWPQLVAFVDSELHPLGEAEQRRLLQGGALVHRDAPARAREILGAAILEAAASTSAYQRYPEGDEGDLSRIKARMLATEHVVGRCRDSRWVRRRLRTRHFVRDDVERLLADDLLARGLASAVTIAWPLTS
jgi:dsRNA-specific ribonuclease